jgi:hypothetical protein
MTVVAATAVVAIVTTAVEAMGAAGTMREVAES